MPSCVLHLFVLVAEKSIPIQELTIRDKNFSLEFYKFIGTSVKGLNFPAKSLNPKIFTLFYTELKQTLRVFPSERFGMKYSENFF